MIETECQQLIVKAVIDGGGCALKLNNRFLIGVVDLIVKLPGHQPMWLEAKLKNLSEQTQGHVWDVGCTKLQQNFLRDWHEAGMLTGVVSFIQTPGKGVASLRMKIYTFDWMTSPPNPWIAMQVEHSALGGPDERFTNIRQQLIEFANG